MLANTKGNYYQVQKKKKNSLLLQTGNPGGATLNGNAVLITLGEFRLNLAISTQTRKVSQCHMDSHGLEWEAERNGTLNALAMHEQEISSTPQSPGLRFNFTFFTQENRSCL